MERHNGHFQSLGGGICARRSSGWRLLLGDDPARIPLDLPAISAKLAAVSPVAAGLTSKTFSNIRSDFMAAVKASGLKPVQRSAKTPLSAEWKKLIADLSARRAHIGLSRLARYASAKGIAPEQINDADDRRLHHRGPRWYAPPQAERPAQKGGVNLERGRPTVRAQSPAGESSVLPPPR